MTLELKGRWQRSCNNYANMFLVFDEQISACERLTLTSNGDSFRELTLSVARSFIVPQPLEQIARVI